MTRPSTETGMSRDTPSRYSVRVTGPAGHSRFLAIGGVENDDPEKAYHYRSEFYAWGAARHYQRTEKNVVCDVVNVDDPEDRCREFA